jgi:hypothetical protein
MTPRGAAAHWGDSKPRAASDAAPPQTGGVLVWRPSRRLGISSRLAPAQCIKPGHF